MEKRCELWEPRLPEFSTCLPFSLWSTQKQGLPVAFSESHSGACPRAPALSPAPSQEMLGAPGVSWSRQPLKASLTGSLLSAGQRLHHAHQHLHPEPLSARRHLPPEREPQGRVQVTAHPRACPPRQRYAPRAAVGPPRAEPSRERLPGSSVLSPVQIRIEVSEGRILCLPLQLVSTGTGTQIQGLCLYS